MTLIQGYFLLMLLNWWLIEQYSSCLWLVALFTNVWCFHSIKKNCVVKISKIYKRIWNIKGNKHTQGNHNALSQKSSNGSLFVIVTTAGSIQTFTGRKHLWKESLPLISSWFKIRSWKNLIIGKRWKEEKMENVVELKEMSGNYLSLLGTWQID